MLEQNLIKLGVIPSIAKVITDANLDETLDNQVTIINKYQLAGFTKKTGLIQRNKQRHDSDFLWVKLPITCGMDYRGLHITLETRTIHETRVQKDWFGRETPFELDLERLFVIELIEPHKYVEDVPEQILDTMIENKEVFSNYYVGTPKIVQHSTLSDPILFGSQVDLHGIGGSPGFRPVDAWVAVLGVWDDDWHEVDLVKLSLNNQEVR